MRPGPPFVLSFLGFLHRRVRFFLSRVKVYALVGESGTGKSFKAQIVAQKYGVDHVIDDGLLIRGPRILAGRSAKEEKSFMAAVKAALFEDKAHRDEVARKLQAEKIRKILILGTSEKMVNKIAARLQLPPPGRIMRIEDFSTQEEIEKALRTRRIEGKHVIPVPTVEVKRRYPAIFHEAIRVFRGWLQSGAIGPVARAHEKSVVRPAYFRPGKALISASALSLMVIHSVAEKDPDIRVKQCEVRDDDLGYRLALTIDVPYGIPLGESVAELQRHIIGDIERYTGILIEEVNIIIDKVTPEAL